MFKLFGSLLAILISCAVVAFLAMFTLEAVFKIDTPLSPDGFIGRLADALNIEQPLIVTPTPYVSPEPTPTPHAMDLFTGETEEKEMVFPVDMSYNWLGDPYCHNGKIICSAGELVDGKAIMTTLVEYDIASGSVRKLSIEAQNDHLIFPVFNDKWLVYFDANAEFGGGSICMLDLTRSGSAPTIVKTVYAGQPEIKLDGDYIAWMERTGSDRDKVFVCDLNTLETTVVQYFSRSGYGTSMPYLHDGILIWAAEDGTYYEDGRTTSSIKYIDLQESSINEYLPGTYVHDPEFNGTYYAWLDAHHSESTDLYYSGGTQAILIDTGVVEFGISDNYIAYSKGEAVWIFVFENQKTYRLTPERESAQFLGVSGGYVMWMDVTSRERDIIRYVRLPI
ncbi:MAG: hypothetical protein J1E60_04795 [Christensenellaceae bacterium]|nr:hypothetical protein [Christensenellaceae bacterium]